MYQSQHKDDHLPPSCIEIYNAWRFISMNLLQLHDKMFRQKGNFTLYHSLSSATVIQKNDYSLSSCLLSPARNTVDKRQNRAVTLRVAIISGRKHSITSSHCSEPTTKSVLLLPSAFLKCMFSELNPLKSHNLTELTFNF